ncbi:MAG: hypothetical protein A2X45_17995 [Lentisphaerae bacterium GWF2_50_93]|nr:MAG: hypothetical protein A2X45_17995 [Lentisphaerae bacterium GWF2_50_93]
MKVSRYCVFETALKSTRRHENPLWDCEAVADFTGPSGKIVSVKAFWDGASVWRIRFSPDEIGRWKWVTRCISGNDPGLHGRKGVFDCVAYRGGNPVYRDGPLKLSDNCRHIVHSNGKPFFWLGDTAWNGVIRGNDRNWKRYLELRAKQKFNIVQFVCCHWRGDAFDEAGEKACGEEHPIRINPSFFQRLDKRVAMINENGLYAAPVVLWSLLKTDVGYKLPEEDATRLAAYIVSRYDAHQLVWLLGGDGRYQDIGIERWKRIGRSVFSTGHDRLAALHPCGLSWIGEEFRKEKWFDIIGYQSGHGDHEKDLDWLVKGPPATGWKRKPPLPVINLEPNYENAHGYKHKTVFNDFHVRRAAYWSLLVSPTAGLTYGHDAIWNWNFKTGPSEGHDNWHDRRVPPWHTGLETPGIRSMTVMRSIFDRLPWTSLMPDQGILGKQPGQKNPEAFVAVAKAADGTLVIYSPKGGEVRLKAGRKISGPLRLVDPRTGKVSKVIDKVGRTIGFPDGRDWLAVCGKGWKTSKR